ncbi:MAG TPA: hypothetical protein VKG24_09340 [Pseudolabrys sp.]|jgi:hypothetical protein|nr:hypothetical protein [Pseudolabrys sp.]
MKFIRVRQIREFFSHDMIFVAIFFICTSATASAAKLVMFEQGGCAWCEAVHQEIASISVRLAGSEATQGEDTSGNYLAS